MSRCLFNVSVSLLIECHKSSLHRECVSSSMCESAAYTSDKIKWSRSDVRIIKICESQHSLVIERQENILNIIFNFS